MTFGHKVRHILGNVQDGGFRMVTLIRLRPHIKNLSTLLKRKRGHLPDGRHPLFCISIRFVRMKLFSGWSFSCFNFCGRSFSFSSSLLRTTRTRSLLLSLGHVLIVVNQLDEAHVSTVTLAETSLDDASVTSGTVQQPLQKSPGRAQ